MTYRPIQVAQVVKMGRGWAVVRNSATLAVTDYQHIAKEIADALNEQAKLKTLTRTAIAKATGE